MLYLSPSSDCDLCMSNFSKEVLPFTVACGHIFCLPCIDVATSLCCPACGTPFRLEEVTRLNVAFDRTEDAPMGGQVSPVLSRELFDMEPDEEYFQMVYNASTRGGVKEMRRAADIIEDWLSEQPHTSNELLRKCLKMLKWHLSDKASLRELQKVVKKNLETHEEELLRLHEENSELQEAVNMLQAVLDDADRHRPHPHHRRSQSLLPTSRPNLPEQSVQDQPLAGQNSPTGPRRQTSKPLPRPQSNYSVELSVVSYPEISRPRTSRREMIISLPSGYRLDPERETIHNPEGVTIPPTVENHHHNSPVSFFRPSGTGPDAVDDMFFFKTHPTILPPPDVLGNVKDVAPSVQTQKTWPPYHNSHQYMEPRPSISKEQPWWSQNSEPCLSLPGPSHSISYGTQSQGTPTLHSRNHSEQIDTRSILLLGKDKQEDVLFTPPTVLNTGLALEPGMPLCRRPALKRRRDT